MSSGNEKAPVHGRYLPALDGVRGIAAMMVVGHHALTGYWPFSVGWTGVALFFVLSGYLITRLARRSERTSGFSFRSFWIKRITRIVPLYYLAVLAFISTSLVGPVKTNTGDALHSLMFYLTFNGELLPHGPMLIAWSLGVEEKFYLLWPIVAFLLLRNVARRDLVALSLGGITLAAGAIANLPFAGPYGALMVGAGAALVEDRREWSTVGTLFARPAVGWLAVGSIAVVVMSANVDGIGAGWVYAALSPPVAALLAHCAHGDSAVVRALSTRPMQWLGARSYGVYLLHALALSAATKLVGAAHLPGGSPWLTAATCVVIALVVANLAHRLVEKPMIDFGHRWASNRGSEYAGTAVVRQEAVKGVR